MFSEMIIDRVKENPLVKKYIKGEFTEKIYFLNAEGGYGKSTSFKSLYYYLVEQGTQANNHIVPIFIDVKQLVEFGEKGSAGNMPRPIEKYIVKNYCGEDSDPNESLLEKVISIFSKNNAFSLENHYTYFIFIDAINEVNDGLKQTIIDEIKQMVESDSVKFFISSRVNESSLPDDTVKYKLLPLNEEKIRVYLDKNFGKTGEKVDLSKINDSLVDILRVPMYLSVFRKTYDERNPYPDIYETKTVRKADILDSFIQKLLDDNKGKERSANKAVIEFVVKYFLPALAFLMANTNGFIIDSDSTEKLNYDYFKKFFKGTKKEVIKNLMNSEAYNPLSICCKTFSILIENRDNFSFTHQNWQDLFVAKHIINCMNAEKLDELGTPVSENVCQFVGEIIREHKDGCGYSKDYMDKPDEEKARKSECDFKDKDNLEVTASPVEDFLQKHNLKSQSPLSAMATKNLIDIMKTSRNGNITAKYDDLDLKYVFFYNSSMPKSTFHGTKLYNYNFIPQGHTGTVRCVSFSPDGTKIVSCGDDKTICLWDANTGVQITKLFGHTDRVNSVSFSSDGTKIVSGSLDGMICIWKSIGNIYQISKVIHTDQSSTKPVPGINSVALFPLAKQIASASCNGIVCIFDVEMNTRKEIPTIGYPGIGGANSIVISRDGTQLASASCDKTIRMFDTETGLPIGKPFVGHEDWIYSIDFSPNGTMIASGSYDKTIRIWNTKTGSPIGEPLIGHTGLVCSVAFSPNGKKIVSGGYDKTIRIWDVETGLQIGEPFVGHIGSVHSVSFSPDGTKIVSGGYDKTVRIWQVSTGTQIGIPLTGYSGYVNSVVLSPDGKRLVSGSSDKTVRIWDAVTGILVGKVLTRHRKSVNSVDFSLVGNKIASGSSDGTIYICDAKSGKKEKIFKSKKDISDVKSVSFSADGKILVSGSADGKIKIWDIKTGKQVGKSLKEHTAPINSVMFSPVDKKIVSGSDDKTVCVWVFNREWKLEFCIKGHHFPVKSVIFTSNGKNIVSGCSGHTIRMWDAKSGDLVNKPIVWHNSSVTSLAISKDNKLIISGGSNKTVHIWGKNSGKVLKGHEDVVNSVAVSRNNKIIVSGSDDETIRIWNLDTHLCRIIYHKMDIDIQNCHFEKSDFKGENKFEFYGTIYSNGGIVQDEFVPKPVPFEFPEKNKKKGRKNMTNMQGNTFTVINDSGKEIKCEILFTYENEKTGVNYIAYTDNTTDEDGNTKVYASIFDPEQKDPELLPIETEEEWQLINSILESLTDSDEE